MTNENVTKEMYLDVCLSHSEEPIAVRVERVIYHRTKTMTVRKWCMKTNMILTVVRNLPAPISVVGKP
jgi:hypothetical protein